MLLYPVNMETAFWGLKLRAKADREPPIAMHVFFRSAVHRGFFTPFFIQPDKFELGIRLV